MEEAWEHYMQAERKDLRPRRAGLLARLLGAPLPHESLTELARLAEEDRLRAEAGLVGQGPWWGGRRHLQATGGLNPRRPPCQGGSRACQGGLAQGATREAHRHTRPHGR